jgi:hypothetical protein
MRAAVVRRPSSSIYLLVPAESKIRQEIFGKVEPRKSRNTRRGKGKKRPREQCPSHKGFIFRVFGVFSGLNCPFQQSLSVSIRVHPWLTLLPLVFRLEVLMFRVDRLGLQGLSRPLFRGVPNRSMVPCQVHSGTILLPVCPGCATCLSHYCECLYCPDARGNAEGRI